MKHLLIIFAKEPVAGSVKTRLGAVIGNERAKDIYSAFLRDVVTNSRDDHSYDLRIMSTPESSIDNLKSLLGTTDVMPQKGGTLSERLAGAFAEAFGEGYEKVIIIGSDSPMVDRDVICDGMDRLKNNDFVIGPATDGGYYLIGAKGPCREIFDKIEWSTEQVFSQTMSRIRDTGAVVSVMDEMPDIDTYDDLVKFREYFMKLPENEKKRTANLYALFKNKAV